jgi:hypothetical protein
MDVILSIPDEFATALIAGGKEPGRFALEAVALEGYRSDALSEYQVKLLLGLEHRLDVHAFLKEHGVPLNYGIEELEQDLIAAREIVARVEAERAAGKLR